MSLHEQIKGEIKEAMKAKDAVKLSVVRGLVSAFTNEVVAKGKTPTDFLEDEETMAVIKRAARQRKDAMDQYTAGGRADLVEQEQAELKVIESYLPAMASREEIETVAKAKIAEMGLTDKTKAGQLVGAVVKNFGGNVDGTLVKEVVDSLLS